MPDDKGKLPDADAKPVWLLAMIPLLAIVAASWFVAKRLVQG